jgi:hypothetical protein
MLCSTLRSLWCSHRGRGYAVAFTVCNDALFVATSRNFVLRHDLSGDTAAGAVPPAPPPSPAIPAPAAAHALLPAQALPCTR